jgi:hypothetical protein
MLFDRSSKSHPQSARPEHDPHLNRGVYYLYLIIGLQVAFVFGLLFIIMVIGKVIATPWWVFLFAAATGATALVYLFRRARNQLRRFRDALQQVDQSGRSYEISIMGGMLTMRVERNPRPLLEANPAGPPLIDAKPPADPPPM